MSQRVVRYEGEGRRRRPVYADEGPSSAAARDPIAMHASGGLPHLGGPTGGAGPVERRLITALERALREEERPSPIAPRPAAARPSPAIQEEPTVTVTPPGEPEATTAAPEPSSRPAAALSRLARAAQEAAAALEAKELADLSWRVASEALERAYQDVRLLGNPAADPFVEPLQPGPAMSEPTTDHAETIPVAAPQRAHTAAESRAAGTAGMLDARARAAALTGAAAAKATNGADHPPAGGGPGKRGLSANQERVLAAIVRHGGQIKAVADELGFKHYQQVTSTLIDIGKKGKLPIELIPKLPAQFARFQGS